MQLMFESVAQFLKRTPTGTIHCTVGNKGVIADLSSKSISAHFQGLPANVLLAATTWSPQIWISGFILPHFDVRTISVAWKLKKLPTICNKYFSYDPMLSKGVAQQCIGENNRRQEFSWRDQHVHCSYHVVIVKMLEGAFKKEKMFV